MIWCHLNESLYIVIVSKQLQHWCQQCTSWYTGTTLHISTCTTFLVSVSATNHNGTEWNSAWEVVEYNKDYSLHTNHRQNIHITDSKKPLKFESAVGDNPFIKKECLYVYLKSQKNTTGNDYLRYYRLVCYHRGRHESTVFHNFNACFESATQSSLCVGWLKSC